MDRKHTKWDEMMRLQSQIDDAIRGTDGVHLDEHKTTESGEKWILTFQEELPDVDEFQSSPHVASIERSMLESGLVEIQVRYD